MFGNDGKKTGKMDTIIGRNTKLEGRIEAKGTIRLDGELVGDLHVQGSAIIGTKGLIKGNVYCTNIYVAGTIEGNVDCKEQLRLTNTSRLTGDIKVKTFIVDENASFEGKCEMQELKQITKNEKHEDKNSDKMKKVEKGA